MGEPKTQHRLSHPARLIGIRWLRDAPLLHIAEAALPGAVFTENQEGGLAAAETLADIGAKRLLTNRIQIKFSQQAAHLRLFFHIGFFCSQGGFLSIFTVRPPAGSRADLNIFHSSAALLSPVPQGLNPPQPDVRQGICQNSPPGVL